MRNANVHYVKDSRVIEEALNIVIQHKHSSVGKSPSYPTFTGKVILKLRGQLPYILVTLRCS